MPHIDVIRSAIAELPKGPGLVVALPGGTTGIGSYIAEALANTFASNGPKLRVYMVGRNAARGNALIAKCEQISPGSEWRFVAATDLALISEVDRCCKEIIEQETAAPFLGGPARLDLLYMTYCYPILKERSTTKEGLDAFISTTYYSRMRFIMQLIPLLAASPLPGHVVSVYAGTFEDGTSPGQFPVGCPPDEAYGVNSVRKHSTFMKTFMFEEFADKYAGKLSLSHVFPGLVDGPGFLSPDMPLWFRILWRIMKPVARLSMTSPETCGQVMLYLGTSRFPAKNQQVTEGIEVAKSTRLEPGGGCYTVGQRGDPQSNISYAKVRREDTGRKVWDHTIEILDRIEAKTRGGT